MPITIDKPLGEYTRKELFEIAEQLGVEFTQRATKPELVAKLSKVTAGGETEPVIDPSVEPSAGPTFHAVDSAPLATHDSPTRIVRPSDVERAIVKRVSTLHPKASDEELASLNRDVDRFRFIRDEGLPSPLRRFRVTLRRHRNGGVFVTEPIEVDAVDEAAAKTFAMDENRISNRDRHHFLATVVLLEE